MSICELVLETRDYVALRGRLGAPLRDIMDHLTSLHQFLEKRMDSILPTLLQQLVARFDFGAKSVDGNVLDYNTLGLIEDGGSLFAPIHETWRSWGLKNFAELPVDSTMSIMELLGKSREKGMLVTELSNELGIKCIHQYIDRLSMMELIQKQIVYPLTKGAKNRRRCNARTNIIHLKRFFAYYDPTLDELQFESEEAHLDILCERIAGILRSLGIKYMSSKDCSSHLKLNHKQMVTLRCRVVNLQHRSSYCPIRFESEELNAHTSSSESCQRKWIVRLHEVSQATNDERVNMGKRCAFNLPLYEQSIYHLNSTSEGMTVTDFKEVMGISSTKRAYNLTLDLVHIYGIPSIKCAEGKQRTHRLLGTQVGQQSKKSRLEPSLKSQPLSSRDVNEKKGANELVRTTPVTSSRGTGSSRTFRRKSNFSQDLTSKEEERLRIILDYLHEKGVCTKVDVMSKIRSVESARGYSGKMDRKSLDRLITILSAQQKMIKRETMIPAGNDKECVAEILIRCKEGENVEELVQYYEEHSQLSLHKRTVQRDTLRGAQKTPMKRPPLKNPPLKSPPIKRSRKMISKDNAQDNFNFGNTLQHEKYIEREQWTANDDAQLLEIYLYHCLKRESPTLPDFLKGNNMESLGGIDDLPLRCFELLRAFPDASFSFNSVVNQYFDLCELTYGMATGISKSALPKPFSRAKRRLIYLISKYKTIRRIVAVLVSTNGSPKNRIVALLINCLLDPGLLRLQQSLSPNEEGAVSAAIQVRLQILSIFDMTLFVFFHPKRGLNAFSKCYKIEN